MKSVSVFGEGSNVFDAIKNAWEKAGQPDDFTVKIINSGKKGFLGFGSKSAIISLFCRIKRDNKKFVSPRTNIQENRFEGKQQQNPVVKRIQKEQNVSKSLNESVDPKKSFQRGVISKKTRDFSWSDELVREITQYFKQVFNIMKIDTPFTVDINKKILNIYLKKSVLASKDEEKSFYISLSHMLMQFLKKSRKKKFEDFHIIINSPLVANDSKSN